MTTTDRNGAPHDRTGRYTEKAATAPGPGAALAPSTSGQIGTAADRIAAIREEHLLATHSNTRGDTVTKSARCSCGEALAWGDREKQHRDHVDTVIFEAGRSAAAQADTPAFGAEQIQELHDRLTRAAATLDESAESYWEAAERSRVRGKAEGVRLALSYLDETIREVERAETTTPSAPPVDDRQCRTFGQHVAATRHARRDCPVEKG